MCASGAKPLKGFGGWAKPGETGDLYAPGGPDPQTRPNGPASSRRWRCCLLIIEAPSRSGGQHPPQRRHAPFRARMAPAAGAKENLCSKTAGRNWSIDPTATRCVWPTTM